MPQTGSILPLGVGGPICLTSPAPENRWALHHGLRFRHG
ncbi:hypothetical protein X971_5412 (plasmid) [Agrobacterium tumefaciens LBA4213 (Ach5)]|nr:hypothetical protein X971_5412 [Agrobacterium tumefaciens LBA4213 (Ach5)]